MSDNQEGIFLTIGRVLMTDLKTVMPWTPYMPAAGVHLEVYGALNNLYMLQGEVFEGKVDEIVDMGVAMGRDGRLLRQGFNDLVQYGMLEISEEGMFTPTSRYLQHLIGTRVSELEQQRSSRKENL